jgi:membrane associated rhomboid family serine protease
MPLRSGPGRSAVQRYLLLTGVGLGGIYVAQFLVKVLLGVEAHHAVFMLEREHWIRMWTPFTSAIAHGHPVHLLANLTGLWLFGAPIVAMHGLRRTVLALYLAAVLGQFMAIASGRGDALGASAGVAAAAAWCVLTSPLWLRQLLPWGWHSLQAMFAAARDGRHLTALALFLQASMSVVHPLLVAVTAGSQLASDVAGVMQDATFAWGTAPAGPIHAAHILGFALGGLLGLGTWMVAAQGHRAPSPATAATWGGRGPPAGKTPGMARPTPRHSPADTHSRA